MFKKKRHDNIVEYQLFGKTIARKEVYPYGYRIYIKDTTIFKKIKIEKLLAYHEVEQTKDVKGYIVQLQDLITQVQGQVGRVQGQVGQVGQAQSQVVHEVGAQTSLANQQLQQIRAWYEIELDKLNRKIDILNSVKSCHEEAFKPYKNKYNGQDVVILATGPTLTQYKPLSGAIHIGVNNAYKYKGTILDFLFVQDIYGLKAQIGDINTYAPEKCQKFYGDVLFCDHCAIPESYVIKTGAKRYYTGGMASPFLHDIASCLMPDFGSVVFSALAFAMYTNPKRIYLVGCDCSDLGYFDSDKPEISPSLKHDMPRILEGWKSFKNFAEHLYPETEIISVNPVGLKGMFKDVNEIASKDKL